MPTTYIRHSEWNRLERLRTIDGDIEFLMFSDIIIPVKDKTGYEIFLIIPPGNFFEWEQ